MAMNFRQRGATEDVRSATTRADNAAIIGGVEPARIGAIEKLVERTPGNIIALLFAVAMPLWSPTANVRAHETDARRRAEMPRLARAELRTGSADGDVRPGPRGPAGGKSAETSLTLSIQLWAFTKNLRLHFTMRPAEEPTRVRSGGSEMPTQGA